MGFKMKKTVFFKRIARLRQRHMAFGFGEVSAKLNVKTFQRRRTSQKALTMTLILLSLSILGCDMRFKPYSNTTYRFKIKYPKTWELRENAEGVAAVFVSPRETPLDTYSENVSIVVQELKGRIIPLGEYTQEAIYQLTNTFKDIQVIESSPVLLSGKSAHKFEYVIKGNLEIKIMHIWTLQNKAAYQITFGCDVDRCKDYMTTVSEMINSFELD